MIKYFCDGVPVEEEARKQLENVASLPFIHHHIAVMPDVHVGCGATIGSVIPTIGAIIPAAVGVDIGCGMIAQKLPLKAHQLPDNLHELRYAIEKAVPHGRTDEGGKNDRGAWSSGEYAIKGIVDANFLWGKLEMLLEKHPTLASRWSSDRAFRHMGTLGTGNHFIELCLDTENSLWVMLHSGSRGIGNAIGNYFISKAKLDMQRWFINLPDKDLAYIPEGSELFNEYVQAVEWAQEFAALNRKIMMNTVIRVISSTLGNILNLGDSYLVDGQAVNCHHNYISKENHFDKNVWITRKGAVLARKDVLGIIPGSMGAKSFIVRGLGNPDSFNSCSHGAGRVMSRTQAKKLLTLEQHIVDTQGVECRKDIDVLDETPRCYKDIDAVMNAQKDLVEIVYTLKQILCVKG